MVADRCRMLSAMLMSVVCLGAAAQSASQLSPSTPQPPQALSTEPATPDTASAHPQTHEQDTARIRMHHLGHLEARLSTDPVTLHTQCRFESEVSTAAPARHIALTFDDGPEPVQTEFILETLKRYNISATFFVIGEQVRRYPDLIRKVKAEGHHLIGNHSWDHPNFHAITPEEQIAEVVRTEEQLGEDMPKKLFRYPYGNSSCETNAYLKEHGYKIVGWHIDSCDWAFEKDGKVDPKEAASCGVLAQYQSDFIGHVLSALRAHNGGILLMHEIHPNTLHQLEPIIKAALADGFVFDNLDAVDFQSSMR